MKRALIIISVVFNVILLAALIYVGGYKTDYFKKLHARLTHIPYVPERADGDCVISWNNCIEKMNMQFDVVFFGDSHIASGDFQAAFPDVQSINLGYLGEDIKGMLRRVEAIAAVHPKKVFLMGGINGLYNQSLEDFTYWYAVLVDSVRSAVPEAELYLNTLLPITSSSYYCDNAKIAEANKRILQIAADRNLTLVDLHSHYSVNNTLPDSMSVDGLHLTNEAYSVWYDCIHSIVHSFTH